MKSGKSGKSKKIQNEKPMITQSSILSASGKFSQINLEIPIIQEDDPTKFKSSTERESYKERPVIIETKAMPVSDQN